MSGKRWAILTGEYPPQPGGVSDYTRLVAEALAAAGDEVQVWCPPAGGIDSISNGVDVHRLPDHFGLRGLAVLHAALGLMSRDTRVLVQYVPHAFGWRGMNVPFCLWLASLRRLAVWIMFHEVAFPVARQQSLKHNFLGTVQRLMARLIHARAARSFVSIPGWEPLLRRLVPRGRPPQWLPIPSTLPTEVDPQSVAAMQQRVTHGKDVQVIGHFSSFGEDIRGLLVSVLPRLLEPPGRLGLLVGRNSELFARELSGRFPALDGRLHATGLQPAHEMAAGLRACDLLVQPYPDGASSRRTTLMAGLALGLPIVTTEGSLSEPLWRESRAVALTPAADLDAFIVSCEALLKDKAQRTYLGRAAHDFYSNHFTLEKVVQVLRSL